MEWQDYVEDVNGVRADKESLSIKILIAVTDYL